LLAPREWLQIEPSRHFRDEALERGPILQNLDRYRMLIESFADKARSQEFGLHGAIGGLGYRRIDEWASGTSSSEGC
jgi:hypothetical protein